MRMLFFCWLCLFPYWANAQDRNEKVRALNSIVDLMDATSRLNQTYYFDTENLARALYHSRDQLNPNYFYSSRTRAAAVYYSGIEKAFRFQELKPDAKQQLPEYMADLIPWLEAREKVQLLLKNRKYMALSAVVSQTVMTYIEATDSLFAAHDQLAEYISRRDFENDSSFSVAHRLLHRNSDGFAACREAAVQLYTALETYYVQQLPPHQTHAAVLLAEKELARTLEVLNTWQAELYAGNTAANAVHDAEIRKLNETGLAKDSLYLYRTRGYGHPNSGWWAHTRYLTFYTSMHSTLYWYVSATYSKEPYLQPVAQHYNKFILSYNSCVENYNRFLEIADGKTFAETSSCCLGKTEIDTNQNVLLKKPRLLYQLSWIDPDRPAEITPPVTKDTSVEAVHREMIRRAVPHHLVYLLDASASMNESDRLSHLKKEAKYLVQLQRAEDRISIVSFATKARVLLHYQSCSDKETIGTEIDRLHAVGTTNITDGVRNAFRIADSSQLENGKTRILLITDGLFELDKPTRKLLRSCPGKNIGFCIIYLGDARSPELEKQFIEICAQAGGQFYNASSMDLQTILLKEATE
jgi:Mg-chelatase subunit ChlD